MHHKYDPMVDSAPGCVKIYRMKDMQSAMTIHWLIRFLNMEFLATLNIPVILQHPYYLI